MSSATSARGTQLPQSTGDTQYNVPNAALRGASSAFSKPPIKPKPQVNTYTGGSNGALLAATKVGASTPRTSTPQGNTSPLRRDWTGGSTASRPATSSINVLSPTISSSTLDVPTDFLTDRNTSPSNIAAKLAAARYSPLKLTPQGMVTPIMSERSVDERDILPPAGSVGNALARLGSNNQQPPKRRGSLDSHSVASTIRAPVEDAKGVDDTPIPPTTALKKMFEQNQSTSPAKRIPEPINVSQKPPPSVKSPKPQRKIFLPPEPKEEETSTPKNPQTPPPVKPKPNLQQKISLSSESPEDIRNQSTSFRNLRKDSLGSPPVAQKPAQLKAIKSPVLKPKASPQRGSRPKSQDLALSTSLSRRLSASLDDIENASSPSSYASAPETQEEEKSKPSVPPPRRSTTRKATIPSKSPSQPIKPRTPTQLASPINPPELFPPRQPASQSTSPPGSSLYHSNYQRESVKAISKHMTGESLSNAIVGAALASSRTASPATLSEPAPQLPGRRHHHHHPHFHHARSPSPPKPTSRLRATLRKEPSSSDDEHESDKYKRKGSRIMGVRQRKHPNKHHEGDRKRWRDTITERERKRYEGVWAANRGLHITPASQSPSRRPLDSSDVALEVLNLVAKEIWLRSRLSEDVLEEVWALVDGRGVGRLRREEFVSPTVYGGA
ncbi:hypothetical protein CC78DRAFT_569356 [Lojkania enalia]|uniref:EH domain-containing protein n=1 Tax=Lojkania enalia TaxID=147567 RepID=A0A9P4K4V6_9PLEO|nr:hypothetical protein CC78DRAFT_569356 [Didymosphaeria enalia]